MKNKPHQYLKIGFCVIMAGVLMTSCGELSGEKKNQVSEYSSGSVEQTENGVSTEEAKVISDSEKMESARRVNTEEAMTKEEADKLKGTGYHNTRPNSNAEAIELKAAQVKCKKCGMHSKNGVNSLCDACQYNEAHGYE